MGWLCIDFSGTTYSNAFIPQTFYGVFDGNGFTISNLHINGSNYLGFFNTNSGTISNLGFDNINITTSSDYCGAICGYNHQGNISNCNVSVTIFGSSSSNYLGGLCGYNRHGNIYNCSVSGSVSGVDYLGGLCGSNGGDSIITDSYATGPVTGDDYLGGLCGSNGGDSIITDSYATGSVTGDNYLGGLCGLNDYGTISNCFATGSVSGDIYLGGLCGGNDWDSIISGSYATGSVSGDDYIGGLCGYNNIWSDIYNCYAVGSVSGDSRLGGICGYNYSSTAKISNCFWDTQTSGMNKGVSNRSSTITNVQGLTTTEMQNISTFLDVGWDFVEESANGTDDLWHMPYNSTGYPMLYWQRDIPGDSTGKYGVDMQDFAPLAADWLDTYAITDLQTLAQFWLEQ